MQTKPAPEWGKLFIQDNIVIFVIILNACVLFFHSFDELTSLHKLLEAIDHSLTVYFLIEMLLRILYSKQSVDYVRAESFSKGWRAYISDGWHKMDFVLNIISGMSLALIFVDDSWDFEYVMVLRVMRVFKFFRFLEFIPNVKKLAESAFRATKASLFIVVGFFVYNFIISLFTCYLFKNVAPEYFGNPFNSFFTIFRVFTGDGWSDIPTSIAKHSTASVAFFAKAYFMMIVMTGGILGLSIINGIFIDEMNRDKEDKVQQINNLVTEVQNIDNAQEKQLQQLENKICDLQVVIENLVKEMKDKKDK